LITYKQPKGTLDLSNMLHSAQLRTSNLPFRIGNPDWMALFSKYGTLVDPELISVGFSSECVGNSDKTAFDYAALEF